MYLLLITNLEQYRSLWYQLSGFIICVLKLYCKFIYTWLDHGRIRNLLPVPVEVEVEAIVKSQQSKIRATQSPGRRIVNLASGQIWQVSWLTSEC